MDHVGPLSSAIRAIRVTVVGARELARRREDGDHHHLGPEVQWCSETKPRVARVGPHRLLGGDAFEGRMLRDRAALQQPIVGPDDPSNTSNTVPGRLSYVIKLP